MSMGRAADAVAHFQQAIRSDPRLTDAYLNLGGALLRHGKLYDALGVINRTFELGLADARAADALDLVRQALAIEESVDTRTLFVQCVRNLPTVPDTDGIRDLMIRALTEPWGRPADLSAAATSLIVQDGAVGDCIARAATAWPRRLSAANCSDRRSRPRSRRTSCCAACSSSPASATSRWSAFSPMRGRCCWTRRRPAPPRMKTSSHSPARSRASASSTSTRSTAPTRSRRRSRDCATLGSDVTPLRLAALAAYEPLHALADAEALLARGGRMRSTRCSTCRCASRATNGRSATRYPSLTPITDDVSRQVRAQYEQNPYPRWIKTAPIGHATTLDAYLARFANFRALGAAAPDVLIAGCGTGQHVATVALQFTDLNILAIDLSRASLAYAQRATRSLGLTGIDYAQADIMALGALGRSFDMIDSSGVLHHLADPFAGWRVLLSLLRPGGVMRLGLYSALGRRDVAAVRQFVAARGYTGDAASIRRCRQELMGFAPGTPQRIIAATSDFFSTSECRDLLFHVQEHNLSLPQIADFIGANALTFLGFEGCARGYQRYAQLFPDDAAMADLGRWARIEAEDPRLFFNMYQFWIQKPH